MSKCGDMKTFSWYAAGRAKKCNNQPSTGVANAMDGRYKSNRAAAGKRPALGDGGRQQKCQQSHNGGGRQMWMVDDAAAIDNTTTNHHQEHQKGGSGWQPEWWAATRGEDDNNDDEEGSSTSDEESLSDGNNEVRLICNTPCCRHCRQCVLSGWVLWK